MRATVRRCTVPNQNGQGGHVLAALDLPRDAEITEITVRPGQ
ncbi:hypothetical protein [Kitasatospora griseola]